MSGKRFSNSRVLVLGGLIVLLLAQGLVSFTTSPEPYPTVRMPGFGTAPNSAGIITTTQQTVAIGYADGEVIDVSAEDLMADFRYSSVLPSLNFMFKPKKNGSPAEPDAAVVDWLRGRAAALGSGGTPQYVQFTWQPVKVDIRDVGITPSSEPQVTRIEL